MLGLRVAVHNGIEYYFMYLATQYVLLKKYQGKNLHLTQTVKQKIAKNHRIIQVGKDPWNQSPTISPSLQSSPLRHIPQQLI